MRRHRRKRAGGRQISAPLHAEREQARGVRARHAAAARRTAARRGCPSICRFAALRLTTKWRVWIAPDISRYGANHAKRAWGSRLPSRSRRETSRGGRVLSKNVGYLDARIKTSTSGVVELSSAKRTRAGCGICPQCACRGRARESFGITRRIIATVTNLTSKRLRRREAPNSCFHLRKVGAGALGSQK